MGKLYFVTGKMGTGKTTLIEDQVKRGNHALYVGQVCRKKFGAANMAKEANPVAPESTEKFVRNLVETEVGAWHTSADYSRSDLFIDGMPRTKEQVQWIKETFGDTEHIVILCLTCPDALRKNNYYERDKHNAETLELADARSRVEDRIYLEVIEEVFFQGMEHCLAFKRFGTAETTEHQCGLNLKRIFSLHNDFANIIMNKQDTSMEELYANASYENQLPQTHKSVEWARRFVEKANVELSELLRELPDTWWSKDMVDVRAARVELIDAVMFEISAAVALGMDAESFAQCFYDKLLVNVRRQRSDYKKIGKGGRRDDEHIGLAKGRGYEITAEDVVEAQESKTPVSPPSILVVHQEDDGEIGHVPGSAD